MGIPSREKPLVGWGVSKSFVLWPRPWGCLHRRARCRGREEGGPGAQATSGARECFCPRPLRLGAGLKLRSGGGGGREVRRAVRTPAATHPPAGAGKTPRHGDPVCKGSLGEVIVINSRSLIPKGFAPSEARCTGGGRRPGSPLHSSPAQIADAVCAESPRTRQGRSLSRPFSPSEGGMSS